MKDGALKDRAWKDLRTTIVADIFIFLIIGWAHFSIVFLVFNAIGLDTFIKEEFFLVLFFMSFLWTVTFYRDDRRMALESDPRGDKNIEQELIQEAELGRASEENVAYTIERMWIQSRIFSSTSASSTLQRLQDRTDDLGTVTKKIVTRLDANYAEGRIPEYRVPLIRLIGEFFIILVLMGFSLFLVVL